IMPALSDTTRVLSQSFTFSPRRLPRSTLFPYTTLFRSSSLSPNTITSTQITANCPSGWAAKDLVPASWAWTSSAISHVSLKGGRSEEHTSELQSQSNLVCRLLLEKKNY